MFFGFLSLSHLQWRVDEIPSPQKYSSWNCPFSVNHYSLCFVVTLVLTGIVHSSKLNVDDALAFSLRQISGVGRQLCFLVAILTLITVCISADLCPRFLL